jgi:hypothetical protein
MGYKNFNFQVKGTPCKSFLCFTTTTPGWGCYTMITLQPLNKSLGT